MFVCFVFGVGWCLCQLSSPCPYQSLSISWPPTVSQGESGPSRETQLWGGVQEDGRGEQILDSDLDFNTSHFVTSTCLHLVLDKVAG